MGRDPQALLDAIPAIGSIGLIAEHTDDGQFVLRGELGDAHANWPGGEIVHGGVISSILDTAATLMLIASTGDVWATVSVTVDYLRPTSLGAVSCTARMLRQGRRLAWTAAELHDHHGGASAIARVLLAATGTRVP